MRSIAPLLLPWFERHGRKHLPWQQNPNAYRVWVSEIMLQQTQVTTVIPYFERFMQSFPDVRRLADAALDDVLQHWAGLGYYARARNLHKAAQMLQQQMGGRFPQTLEGLMSLPGIGRSTAGAILSLACGKHAVILDGNVKRVLARVHQIAGWPGKSATARQLWRHAEQQTPPRKTAQYNQAMMDLGSMLCTRSRPACQQCPLQDICASHADGTQAQFPQAKPKKPKPQRHRWFLLHQCEDRLLLHKRPPSGIWGGLWCLPEIETLDQLSAWQQQRLGRGFAPDQQQENLLKHAFTHFDLAISVAKIPVPRASLQNIWQVEEGQALQWVELRKIPSLGMPTPMARILT